MDIEKIRKDFPILNRMIDGKRLVYLDSAATSQKPIQVIKALEEYYSNHNSNIHRTVHRLGEESTQMFEDSRKKVAEFIGAKPEEIIFTKNATEAINIVAWSMKEKMRGKKIVSTVMEHHSNIVPWQMLEKNGSSLDFVDIDQDGQLNDTEKTIKGASMVAVAHSSNVLGTVNDIRTICRTAKDNGTMTLVDGAQSVPHMPVDVKDIGCDFLVFSGHKMLGPTGVGVLYAKEELADEMEPFLRGGDMIKEVSLHETTWNKPPMKFEAGTPNIADVVAFKQAVEYLQRLGMENVENHERELASYAVDSISDIDGIKIYGPKDRSGLVSFNIGNIHPHDVASIVNEEGVAIRSGHLCAQPLMARFGVPAMARASFYIYNTKEEIAVLADSLEKVSKTFKR